MIKLSNIKKIYNENQDNEYVALRNINLSFKFSGLILITGRSGCGKSTLLNLIASIDKPSEGYVEIIGNKDNYCAMVFQDFQLVDYLCVEDNLKLANNISSNGDLDFIYICEKYGISEILKHFPNQISGGQKQRVAIVRAILLDRPILLCDEPTGNLDDVNSKLIADMLKEESKSRLVIVVSHDEEEFLPLANRVITMKNAGIISDETIEDSKIELINKDHKVNFGYKEKTYLIKKFYKKSFLQHFFTVVCLFLSFLLLISALNGLLNNRADIMYNNYKNEETIDLTLQDNGFLKSLSYDEQAKYLDNKRVESIFYDFDTCLGNAVVKRIYISDVTVKTIIYGTNKINENEILISDYVAYKNSDDIANLINKKIDGFVVKGIYKTSYKSNFENNENYDLVSFQNVYMTKETFEKYNVSDSHYTSFFTSNSKSSELTIYNNSSKNAIYGENDLLGIGEVAISLDLALSYTDNPEDLIGKDISIFMFIHLSKLDLNLIDEKEYTFNVKYIFWTQFTPSYQVILSTEDYYNASYYSSNLSSIANGICISKSVKAINSFYEEGFIDNMYLSTQIDSGIDWLSTLTIIEISLGIIMYVISLILIINFIHSIFLKEKRIQGILISFGISRKSISSMYLILILIQIIFSLILASVFGIFVVSGVNSIILANNISIVQCLFYSPLSVIYVLIGIVFLIYIIYFFINKKLYKKQIVDIIYER